MTEAQLKGLEKGMMEKLAYGIHREIVETERVDTGRLRSSYVVKKTEDGWIIGTNVEYAPYVEMRFGTVRNAIGQIPNILNRIIQRMKSD